MRQGRPMRFTVGVGNALGNEAGRKPNPTAIGNVFSSRVPFDTNGLYGYARIQYRWGVDARRGALADWPPTRVRATRTQMRHGGSPRAARWARSQRATAILAEAGVFGRSPKPA